MPQKAMQHPGGMMAQGGMTAQGKPFNGDIDVGGRKVNVTNGVVDGSVPGNMVYVAADGGVVFNDKQQILGSLDENNVLQKPDQALVDRLKAAGLTQESGAQ